MPSLVPINLTFNGTNDDWIEARLHLPFPAVLETISVRCRAISGVQTVGISTMAPLPDEVSVTSNDPNMTPVLVYQSNLVWPTLEWRMERILPVTQVGLPVGNSFGFWVGDNITNDPINCDGTAVVRYLK